MTNTGASTGLPFNNVILHYIVPIGMFVQWIINPPKSMISLRRAVYWLLFPITYVAYALIRGLITATFIYPFLSPVLNGYGSVVITIGGITVFTFILTIGIVQLQKLAIKLANLRVS